MVDENDKDGSEDDDTSNNDQSTPTLNENSQTTPTHPAASKRRGLMTTGSKISSKVTPSIASQVSLNDSQRQDHSVHNETDETEYKYQDNGDKDWVDQLPK